MSSTPWFRFYNEALNDPKLKRIATITKQPKALINGVWCGLLCLASESPDRGKLLISDDMPYLMEEIIDAVGIDYELGELIIDYLIKLEMVSLADGVYSITKWDEMHPKGNNGNKWNKFRSDVWRRDRGRCVYCGAFGNELDHIVPRSKGGADSLDNLVLACRSCNHSKFNHDMSKWYTDQPFYDDDRHYYILSVSTFGSGLLVAEEESNG